jgi:hypothetical protein
VPRIGHFAFQGTPHGPRNKIKLQKLFDILGGKRAGGGQTMVRCKREPPDTMEAHLVRFSDGQILRKNFIILFQLVNRVRESDGTELRLNESRTVDCRRRLIGAVNAPLAG